MERASLEEALNIRTSVASRSEMKLRETPGLVTVITREEIQAMAPRNLADVLKLVPEFDFAVDVQGNLGLGIRGNWANEGKVLLLWDGQSYNETLYSTIQFDRFPVDQVEEIEIIKGPGSAMYGGHAELGVINIRTRGGKSLRGSAAYAAYGQGRLASARRFGGYSFGRTFPGGEFSVKAHWEESQRSDRRYTDQSGGSYSLNGDSALRPRTLNIGAAAGGASARLIIDDFRLRDRDHFGTVLSTGSGKAEFPSIFAEISHKIRLPWLVVLEPKINYARAMPWLEKDEHDTYDKKTERITAALSASKKFGAALDIAAGGEYFHDGVKVDPITAEDSRYADGRSKERYDNYAFYGEAALRTAPANVTAGARYDKHSRYGSSLVPRIALTRLYGGFNFKAIFSQAFRAPAIENIRLAEDAGGAIRPEKATSVELEAGYKFSEILYFSGNVFQTTIRHPIVFDYSGAETYSNYDRTGTQGLGLTAKFKRKAYRAELSYQCYSARSNRVDVYSVPGRGSYLLGMPRHKAILNSFLPLGKGLTMNASAAYFGRRYRMDAPGSARPVGGTAVTDLNFLLKDRPLKALSLSLGIKDLFASGLEYLQPYDGGHAPLPAPSREIFLKAAYEF